MKKIIIKKLHLPRTISYSTAKKCCVSMMFFLLLLLFLIVQELSAGEYIFTPPPAKVTVTHDDLIIKYHITVNGEDITSQDQGASCGMFPKDYRPLACPAGYTCKEGKGTTAFEKRERAKVMWEVYKSKHNLQTFE